MQRKGKLCEPFVGLQTGAATVRAVWSFLKNLKIELSYDPVIPLLGICPKKPENTNLKEHKHPCVHCSVIYHCKDMEAAQVPISR